MSFSDFASKLAVEPLHQQLCEPEILSGDLLKSIKMNWAASDWQHRNDDERKVQPVIHEILTCAAEAAETIASRNRSYLVVSEPSVVTGKQSDKQLSDESVVEIGSSGVAVAEEGVMRILVEIKGTGVFPYFFHRSDRCDAVFSQIIQEAALSLKSGLWRKELLCGIASRGKWFTFKVLDQTTDGIMQLRIVESTSAEFNDPRQSMTSIQQWVYFLAHYLCEEVL